MSGARRKNRGVFWGKGGGARRFRGGGGIQRKGTSGWVWAGLPTKGYWVLMTLSGRDPHSTEVSSGQAGV